MKTTSFVLATLLLALGLAWPGSVQAQAWQDRFVIGTGGKSGVYYLVGRSICRFYHRHLPEQTGRCRAYSTPGSIFNLHALADGSLQMAVVQSDWQYHAYEGTSVFADRGPMQNLRAIFSVHQEPFTVVVRGETALAGFDDLRGQRVNIGNPGSGQRGTMEVLMAAKGWSRDAFKLAYEMESGTQASALCRGFIDAFVYTVGHPNGSVAQAMACGGRIVPVTGPAVETLIAEHPYYLAHTIKAGTYAELTEDVATFAVSATLVATTETPDEVVEQVLDSVFTYFEGFRKQHPAFATLTPAVMVSEGLTAPMHPAAAALYRERGWR